MPKVRIHLKLWLDYEGEVLLGAGRTELLRRIGEMGSLKKAAESMNMSYRAAWGRLKRAEAALGQDLVTSAGARRDGYQLTAQGRALVEAFSRWQEEVRTFALQRAIQLPFAVEGATSDSLEGKEAGE